MFTHLESNYGWNCWLTVRSLEKKARDVAKYCNHLRFKLQCRQDVIPRSVHLNSSVTGHRAENILRNAERKLVNEIVWQVNGTIDHLQQKQQDLVCDLLEKLPDDECSKIKTFIDTTQICQHERTKTQQRKFELLIQEKTKITSNSTSPSFQNKNIWVKNSSLTTLQRFQFCSVWGKSTDCGNDNGNGTSHSWCQFKSR